MHLERLPDHLYTIDVLELKFASCKFPNSKFQYIVNHQKYIPLKIGINHKT